MPGDPQTDGAIWSDGALSTARAVEFSGISRTDLFALMRAGHLPWFKRGHSRYVPKRALVALLDRFHREAALRG